MAEHTWPNARGRKHVAERTWPNTRVAEPTWPNPRRGRTHAVPLLLLQSVHRFELNAYDPRLKTQESESDGKPGKTPRRSGEQPENVN